MLINPGSTAVAILKSPSVGLRTRMHRPTEVLAEIAGGVEAAGFGDGFDRQITRLEKTLSQMDTLALEPVVRCRAGRRQEASSKGSRAHGGP